mmetsp:Transcript_27317/g.50231  ORF Transcript_27317/g.50231 Transcript_27317/m.50231 type:complete len:675 (+) Transcript_27317:88-2112(+)
MCASESEGLPRFPVAVSRTYVQYHEFHAATSSADRPRSAPIKEAVGQRRDPEELRAMARNLGGAISRHEPRRSSPQKKTREVLHSLSLEELCGIAHDYGLEKLCCQEDREAALRILPVSCPFTASSASSATEGDASSSSSGRRGLRSIRGFLEHLSWEQLITLLRQQARRRMGNPPNDAGAEYFEWVCNILLASQLRDAALCEPALGDTESVMAWRMSHICEAHGLASWWMRVAQRLCCGELVFLTSRAVPLLDDEVRAITRLVARSHVISISAEPAAVDRFLRSCDVIYIGGAHDRELSRLRLDDLHATLAILNVCSSEKLAKSMLLQGVRHAVYWPTFVHDSEAVAFGIALVRHLFKHRIVEAFAKAKHVVHASERAPRLISGRQEVPEIFQVSEVILQHRIPSGAQRFRESGKPGYAGKRARILPHTVMNGWVKVRVGDDILSWRVGHWQEVVASPERPKPACQREMRQLALMAPTRAKAFLIEDSVEDDDRAVAPATPAAPAASVANVFCQQAAASPDSEDTQYFLNFMLNKAVCDEVDKDVQYFSRCPAANRHEPALEKAHAEGAEAGAREWQSAQVEVASAPSPLNRLDRVDGISRRGVEEPAPAEDSQSTLIDSSSPDKEKRAQAAADEDCAWQATQLDTCEATQLDNDDDESQGESCRGTKRKWVS